MVSFALGEVGLISVRFTDLGTLVVASLFVLLVVAVLRIELDNC